VYLVGAFVTLQVILGRLPGGWDGLIDFGRSTGRFRVFDFSPSLADPYTFWAGVVGGTFLTLGTHGTDQLTVQRLLSSRSQADASRALILSGFIVLGQFALFLLIGVGLAAYFQAFPSRMPILKPDGAFATFIVEALPTGICGLMLAAVFAAAMSTLSSSLNASAGAAVSDLIEPNLKNPSPRRLLMLSRILTVAFGIAQVGIGLLGPRFGGSVVDNVLGIAALPTGIILGVFGLGVLTTRVTQPAALAGFLAGLITVTGVKVCNVAGYFALGWPWYAFIGAITTFAVGYLASYLVTERRSEPSAAGG
jgi:solute:Na+ symporter, SSS family